MTDEFAKGTTAYDNGWARGECASDEMKRGWDFAHQSWWNGPTGPVAAAEDAAVREWQEMEKGPREYPRSFAAASEYRHEVARGTRKARAFAMVNDLPNKEDIWEAIDAVWEDGYHAGRERLSEELRDYLKEKA